LFNLCEKLLIYFYEKFGRLYGKRFISHNVHELLHITNDYKQYGVLDQCSCFPFKNYVNENNNEKVFYCAAFNKIGPFILS